MSNKPIILAIDGIFSQLADGAIINAGGTSHNGWTVDGRGLLYDDGTSTSPGSTSVPLSLQSIYNISPASAGSVKIKLSAGKDLVIADDTDDNLFFKIDAETGKVTITGDFEVLGSSSTINTIIQDSDHWLISPKLGSTTALKIEPDFGVIPIVDLVSIRRTFGTPPVFRIDSAGNQIATTNLTVGGLINGVDVVQTKNNLDSHLAGDPGFRHLAGDIDVIPIATLPGAQNVQEALEAINTKIESGGTSSSNVRGYEHIQATESATWVIVHNKNSMRVQSSIYNDDWEQVFPDRVKIIDANTVYVYFAEEMTGRAIILVF